MLATSALGGLLVVWFVLFRPTAIGGPAAYATVAGTSMEPGLHTGDMVIAQAQDSYRVGDVVVYRIPDGDPGDGALVIHRIIGGSARDGFILQGDNRDLADPWRPTSADILGRGWITIPAVGNLMFLLRNPVVVAAMLGLLAFVWVLISWPGKPSTAAEAAPR
ncbi:MAG TPA: signal peptidase I [Candidatus Limnocylindria bacterium]